MADIAAEAGVSKNAVSLALRNSPEVSEATRARILTVAKRMKYRKNALVAQLMAEMRRSKEPRFQSTLALLNANPDRQAFHMHPTIPAYVDGCNRRALQLGYALDEFWLHEPGLEGLRLNKILHARAIQGVIVVGLMRENRLPESFLPTWKEFPVVVTGVRTQEPALSFASTDPEGRLRINHSGAFTLGAGTSGVFFTVEAGVATAMRVEFFDRDSNGTLKRVVEN